MIFLNSCTYRPPSYSSFEEYPVYTQNDWEVVYQPDRTTFRIWSPVAEAAEVLIYKQWDDSIPVSIHKMEPSVYGTWLATCKGDLNSMFYTFRIKHEGIWLNESPGVFAKATGVNGQRGFIFDPKQSNPEGWDSYVRPGLKSFSDIILYELHIRDLSINPNSGIRHPGKFLGLAEENTLSSEGLYTGLSHMVELGVTHIHILPAFDFRSIDETKLSENKYNWGYDPQNYNLPEGSFSTDPYQPLQRIREMKQMIMQMHKNGLRVVMDVVYNHTGETENSVFNLTVPGYFYRKNEQGSWSNASGCGNEIASERAMVRHYIIESVKYWAREYHIDGFRFDLMGIHDIETMNQIKSALSEIDPSIFVYGEGWLAGDSPLPENQRAIKNNVSMMPDIAVFCDEMRDGIKGHWGTYTDKGFVSGKPGQTESVKFGIVGAIKHQDVDYSKVNYSKKAWAAGPLQCINYVSCHDNHTLWDRFMLSCPEASKTELIKMNRLSNFIVLTSQGIPFLHNGVEFMRSKKGVENSFESPDNINQVDWSLKHLFTEEVAFYKQLIQLRKNHPALKMETALDVNKNLRFIPGMPEEIIAYTLNGAAVGDSWKHWTIVINAGKSVYQFKSDSGNYRIVYDGSNFFSDNQKVLSKPSIEVPAISAVIIVKD